MEKQDQLIDQLKQEVEKLKAENSALLKLASHDMRSPLNKIFALVNLLKMSDDPLSREQESYVESIEKVLGDGLQRMRNLMDLRTIENNQVSLHREPLDISALITKIVREYVSLAERKSIALITEITPLKMISDRLVFSRILDQLLQMRLNLVPQRRR